MEKKKKQKSSTRELVDKYQANCDRIGEIAEACDAEQRERTEAEDAEFKALTRENEVIRMKMQAAQVESLRSKDLPVVNNDKVLRENLLERGQKVTVLITREGGEVAEGIPTVTPQTTEALAETGIIPVHEQEMLKPIRKGLIYDKVGLNIRSGLSGTLRWPKHGKATASFADEAERLVDSSIQWDKLETNGHRMGIAVPITREELEDSHGIVESVVKEEMPKAITDLINGALFSTVDTYTAADGNTKTRKVVGPFVAAAKKAVQFTGAVPTRKELLRMVASIAEKIDLVAPCWVMTESMKAELCDVKVDAGSGRFLCENGMILGYPVFTTAEIGAGNIGFGDWSYQAAGFFGDWTLIADPYTLARKNSVDFVLNARFGTVTLRDDAFVLGKIKTA
ncbi:phage major capsid protein [Duncaniella freteri]|uniref:phage major capsid protein n=1 Tax=Duncaniella freteri TaxID=2530391 RepID=UPI002589658F|nr:phage major capsid protein [Duncaniella freteri]